MNWTIRRGPLALAFFLAAAWATTYGPFPISSIGPSYASTTYAMDAAAEFSGANKVAQVYLSPILNTPLKIAKAIREDTVRVAYYDGQIAEFKIARWPSTAPLDFSTKLSSASQQTPPRFLRIEPKENCYGDYSTPITVQTGYFGSRTEFDAAGNATIIGSWISTGFFTYFPTGAAGPYPRRCP